jgi:predicted DNA-binding protein (UPF0251 family)
MLYNRHMNSGMRGRPKIKRCISYIPEITYYKPAGVPLRDLQEEILGLDEVEALRLTDIENLDQETAAQKMGVARVTYLKIIHSAHRKVSRALIYGKSIQMKGGDIVMPNLDGTGPRGLGPRTGRGAGRRSDAPGQRVDGSAECTCPSCGETTPHRRGTPCSQSKCPKCETPMRGVFCK